MKLAVPIKYIERRDMYKNNKRKLCEEKGLISEKGPVPLSKKKIGARCPVKKEFNNTHKPKLVV